MNEKFVFDAEFFEGAKVRTHVPSAFFIKYHEHRGRIGDSTRTDNTCDEKLLNNFLNFIFLGKGMTIWKNIGRKATRYEGNGMIMHTMRRRKSFGSGKKNLMFGDDGLEVKRNKGCLIGLNGMELCNYSRMTFFEYIFHARGTNDLRGTCCDFLEFILLSLLVVLHG
jgi:hypothetical protein